ncbi:MAG: zinc-ribbon domain-containing protein [Psychrosphaera sp.]|nr:zinc-ribbon domain-containing protein [Psychrosphaera sp.]
MKSGKQRRLEIKAKRLENVLKRNNLDIYNTSRQIPTGAVAADHAELAHNNTYNSLPVYYADRAFICRDCGSSEIWTAKQQKWWYEIVKGDIHSFAVRCRRCRNKIKDDKVTQKQHMKQMSEKPPHPHQAFFTKKQ